MRRAYIECSARLQRCHKRHFCPFAFEIQSGDIWNVIWEQFAVTYCAQMMHLRSVTARTRPNENVKTRRSERFIFRRQLHTVLETPAFISLLKRHWLFTNVSLHNWGTDKLTDEKKLVYVITFTIADTFLRVVKKLDEILVRTKF